MPVLNKKVTKKTLLALGTLRRRDCDVIEFLAAVVQKDGVFLGMNPDHITLDQRITAAKILTPCAVPQLRSVEMEMINPQPMNINVFNYTKPPIPGDGAKVIDNPPASTPAAPLLPATKFTVPVPKDLPPKYSAPNRWNNEEPD